jgi:hypothetical protein
VVAATMVGLMVEEAAMLVVVGITDFSLKCSLVIERIEL